MFYISWRVINSIIANNRPKVEMFTSDVTLHYTVYRMMRIHHSSFRPHNVKISITTNRKF